MAFDLAVIERQLQPLRPKFADLLSTVGVPPERIIRSVIISLEQPGYVGDQLRSCTPTSIIQAATTGAVLGLECDGATGQGFLVPFRRRREGIIQAQWITGYKGYNTLGARAGLTINGNVVREGDQFDYEEGTAGFVRHKRLLGGGERRIIAAWATASALDRPPIVMVLDIDEILAVKERSQASRRDDGEGGAFSPWSDPKVGFPAMAGKTAKRRLARALPLSAYIHAARIDEAHEEQGRHAYLNFERELVIEGQAQPIGGADQSPGPSPAELRRPSFLIKGARGEVRTGTIEEWHAKMLAAISDISNRAALERFRDMNLPIMDDYREGHQRHVAAVAAAFEEKLK